MEDASFFPVRYATHDHKVRVRVSTFRSATKTIAKFQNPSIHFSGEHEFSQSTQVTMKSRLWLIILSLSVNSLGSESERTDVAYASLLYGDEFLLGVRVLGKSIRDTRSSKDMVVLVSDGVSDYANNLLKVHSHFHSTFYLQHY